MVVQSERQASGEQLSRPEEARIAHETATDLANRFPGIPEFSAALSRTFFGRNFGNGGRKIIADGVFFNMGDHGYHVSYRGEPLRFSSSEVRDYDASIRMEVVKYGKKPIEGVNVRRPIVASLYLSSSFTEDQDGKVKEYKTGGVNAEDGSGKYQGLEAVAKISENFGELYSSFKL